MRTTWLLGSMAFAVMVACGGADGTSVLNGGGASSSSSGGGGSSGGVASDGGGGSSGGGSSSGGSTGSAPSSGGSSGGGTDAGPVEPTPDGGPIGGDAGSDPFAAAPTCTSGKTWNGGDNGSSSMHPGTACIACHAQTGGPTFTIAGTAYPTGHEPDDCDGVAGLQVVVTDANAKSVTLTTNGAGNFDSRTALAPPYAVKVVSGGKERAMITKAPSGDCGSCHTQDGANGAPGRIVAP